MRGGNEIGGFGQSIGRLAVGGWGKGGLIFVYFAGNPCYNLTRVQEGGLARRAFYADSNEK